MGPPTLVKKYKKNVTLFWGTSTNWWLDLKVCADMSVLLVLKKISHFDGKNGQKLPLTCDYKILDPQNPLSCIKDQQIYIYKM